MGRTDTMRAAPPPELEEGGGGEEALAPAQAPLPRRPYPRRFLGVVTAHVPGAADLTLRAGVAADNRPASGRLPDAGRRHIRTSERGG